MADRLDLAAALVRHALTRPHAPALHWHDETVSYAELHASALRAANRLAGLDLGRDEPVAVVAAKSPAAIALVLGCLITRRPVLLPSPALPEQTLTALAEQAGCRYVLGVGDTRTVTPGPPVVPAGTAMLLTTSGSTGLPKVVPVPAGAMRRFAAWAGDAFGLGPGRAVLNYAPLNFDLCLLDVWATLAHGGAVVLVDPERATQGRHLAGLLTRHDVAVVQAVPMAFGLLQETGETFGAVRHAMVTGDAVAERTLAGLPALFPGARLHNVYGCTETNDSFVHEIDPAEGTPVPIGRPLPGVAAAVVDAAGAVLDGPGEGELYVRTPFQTPGYLDPARTAERFTTDPRGLDAEPWYRTGDLVRRDAAGRLLLIGRSDFQVKIRGVAVNTAEIERILLAHPDIVEAAVVAGPDPVAGHRLLSTVRRRPASRINSLTLRQHCAGRLPRAAIPSVLRIVDDPLPRTSTGKVDRTAVGRLAEPVAAEERKS
ncbi:AMP-binding protein [Spirilliplanes yamanashiensis]|uniref:Uncharacterized protein n=1 Tax=Spirilliplanes yamanashiensis TaxID=42233 RepID=A0A8J3Y512_9ACTN|nr:AMP-binding protein [Spirilliplanes yamanashiensis]MDP9819314.1 acyl-coenzyme A synthetase/AMP-(fatty) acid ligase [Spirilliplanes yamanashiensis]GIJ01863.1 hypothetical protein Sya03_12150 [Spirilliplanes yamanashiensis]